MKALEIHSYPNSTPLFSQSMSAAGGGGGEEYDEATADPLEIVVAFYEERLGAAQRDAASGSATWHFPDPDGRNRGGQHLEVWPADGAYPFREAPGSSPLPPEARTVICHSTLYLPAEPDRSWGPPDV